MAAESATSSARYRATRIPSAGDVPERSAAVRFQPPVVGADLRYRMGVAVRLTDPEKRKVVPYISIGSSF